MQNDPTPPTVLDASVGTTSGSYWLNSKKNKRILIIRGIIYFPFSLSNYKNNGFYLSFFCQSDINKCSEGAFDKPFQKNHSPAITIKALLKNNTTVAIDGTNSN